MNEPIKISDAEYDRRLVASLLFFDRHILALQQEEETLLEQASRVRKQLALFRGSGKRYDLPL